MNLLASTSANASTITVNTAADLQTAITNASAGDIIILANGTYLNSTLSISKSNITVRAATPGGVYWNSDVTTSSPRLAGNSLPNRISITGSNVTFSGFQFTAGDIGGGFIIEVIGNYNILTQLNFSSYYAQKYIRIADGSHHNEISFCNLEKKPAAAVSGCTIQINTSNTVPGYNRIRYCSFQNYYGNGGDFGNEPIRIGLGSENDNASKSIVEYSYFNNTGLGDSESVSIKSKENTIRFCTFTNQQNAMLCFRNGDNNVAYSNFFINAGGIRVKEANNIFCYNNYFQNSGSTSGSFAADAVTLLYVTPAALRTSNLVNINFIHNTFVDCANIDLGGIGATNTTWANTIFKKSGTIFTNANSGTSWVGNIYQGTLGITINSGMTNSNPNLIINPDGYYGLSSSSPMDNANSSYPTILDIAGIDDDFTLAYDISGQARPSTVTLKDVGCDEYTTGTTTNHPLVLSEVGPDYLRAPLVSVQPTATSVCSGITTSFMASSSITSTVQWQRSADSGVTWTPITATLDAGTTYSNFTTETLVLTGSASAITNYQYKAVFSNSNGSSASNAATLTVYLTAVAVANSQTLISTSTVASLTATGTALKWYAAATGGSFLATTTTLVSGNYYVTQTLNGCESARTVVAVTIQEIIQTITFSLPLKYTNSPDFDPAAVSSNTSAITYSSDNAGVATIVNNKIHIVAKGTANITAASSGAVPVTQQLIVQCSCVQN